MSTTLKKLIPYWPPIFVGLLLAINALYARLQQLPLDQSKIQYGLVLLYRDTAFYLVVIAVVNFVILMGYLLRAKWRISRSRDIIYALSITMLAFVGVPSSCWAALTVFVEGGTTFVHVDRTIFNGETYQLAYMGQPTYGKSSYNLYRCDSLGVTCERVYQVDTSIGTDYTDSGDLQIARTARILGNPTLNSLSIVVGTTKLGDYAPS